MNGETHTENTSGVTNFIDPKSGKPILDRGEYYIIPGYPLFYARKEYRGRIVTIEEYVEIVKCTLRGESALIKGFESKKGTKYDLKIRISDDGEQYDCHFPPLHPLDIKCPKSGEPVDDRGKYFAFPGFPNLFCPKEMFGRRMTAEDYVQILSNPGKPQRFGEFISKKGNPYTASLKYNTEENRINLEFDDKKGKSLKAKSAKKDEDADADIPQF